MKTERRHTPRWRFVGGHRKRKIPSAGRAFALTLGMQAQNPYRVGIIGAGPAGATAAYQLTKAGIHVDLYEGGPTVGGMAKTVEMWGQKVDIGPHRFFSSDARVNRLWLEVLGRDYSMVKRLTRIYYGGRL